MSFTTEQLAPLAPRKREAVTLICAGLDRSEICERMKICTHTLWTYLADARAVLGLEAPWEDYVLLAKTPRCRCGLLADAGHIAAGCGLGRAEDYARSGLPAGG